MPPAGKTQAELQAHRQKLLNSYQGLLEEFSSDELRNVGNYALGRLIGKGSFGKVYLATHKLTNGSKVVLKSARKDDANLAREIHHHRQFRHPHIARLYEVIVTEKLVWMVLEYCPGDELYTHLLNHGPMEPSKVQRIFTQLVGAVAYVHQKSCVHRDLKLENILLDKHGNVKLVDFGFTREYEEMLKGEKYAGEKVDVWSLGIILFALLCGELPFDEDDETATKTRILKEEPKYPESVPPAAKDLIVALLSKRPLLRPSLADILTNPWLTEHAPYQVQILKLQQPEPFSTDIETQTLARMKSAGVNIDMVISHVLEMRCDALAGWWALLLEKEERKAKRLERKRKEREAEAKSLRRLSAASSRLERMAPTIRESDEEGQQSLFLRESSRPRGRNPNRLSSRPFLASSQVNSANTPTEGLPSDLPKVQEGPASSPVGNESGTSNPTERTTHQGRRSASSSRSRPPPPPKERRVSRGSMLHIVTTNPDLIPSNGLSNSGGITKRRRYHPPLLNQFLQLKHWIKESARRTRSPSIKSSNLSAASSPLQPGSARRHSTTLRQSDSVRRLSVTRPTPETPTRLSRPDLSSHGRGIGPQRPRITTPANPSSATYAKPRTSLSPSPITPHSSYRRSSGLRGRKSTSSSVSSIRSFHHVHSHSKTSSTSSASASVASPIAATPSAAAAALLGVGGSAGVDSTAVSPHTSMPALSNNAGTSTPSIFSSGTSGQRNEGLMRKALPKPLLGLGESSAAFSSLPPPSPGLIFTKRKRSPFKGPTLGLNTMGGGSNNRGRHSNEGSRSGSVGRRSGEGVIEEEEEEDRTRSLADEGDEFGRFGGKGVGMGGMAYLGEEDDEEIEEVDVFSPVQEGDVVLVVEPGEDVEDAQRRESAKVMVSLGTV